MGAKPVVTRPQFQQIDRLLTLTAQRKITQDRQDQLGIGSADHRIAGDVVWHFAAAPGVDVGTAEIVALQLLDQALEEGLLLFEIKFGYGQCHFRFN
jgi:hypothetical protein